MNEQRLRLILKTSTGYHVISWLKKRKNENGLIGWMLPLEPMKKQLGLSEIHFWYPDNGNYHVTYEFREGDSLVKVHQYWNKLSLDWSECKTYPYRLLKKIHSQLEYISHLGPPHFPQKPIQEKDNVCPLPSIGGNVIDGTFLGMNGVSEKSVSPITDRDTLIDITEHKNVFLSAQYLLRPKNRVEIIQPLPEFAEPRTKSLEINESVTVELVCNMKIN